MDVRFDCVLRNEEDFNLYLASFQTSDEKQPRHRLPETIAYPCVPVVYEIRSGTSYSHTFISLAEMLAQFAPDEVIDACPNLAAYGADRLEEAHVVPQKGPVPAQDMGDGKVTAHFAFAVARKPLEVQRHLVLWDGKDSISVPSVCVQGSLGGVEQRLSDLVTRTLLAAAEDSQSAEVSHAVDDS